MSRGKTTAITACLSLLGHFIVAQNTALNFGSTNGSHDEYLTIGTVNGLTDWTVEFWFKPNAIEDFQNLIHSDAYYGSFSTKGFRVQIASDPARPDLMVYAHYAGGVSTIAANGTLSLDWHHLALVADDVNDSLICYLDGQRVLELATDSIPAKFDNLILGKGWDLSHSDRDFDGEMDEFRLWTSARSEAEILDNMYKSISGSSTDLLISYDFEDGTASGSNSGVSTLDNKAPSGSAYDGSLNGFDGLSGGDTSNFVTSFDLANEWDGSAWSEVSAPTSGPAQLESNTAPSGFTADQVIIGMGVSPDISSKTITIQDKLLNAGNGFSGTGTVSFDNNGDSTEILGKALSFEGVVEVASGTDLITNDLLTLKASSDTSYGMLTGTGTVTGNVTVEQWVDLPAAVGGVDGRWIEVAANVTAPIIDWREGTNIMVAANSAQGTVWQYDADNGNWDVPSDINGNAELGRGYSIYAGTNNFGTFLRSGDGKIDLSGAPKMDNLNITLNYDQGSDFNSEGWNLIGNPYAAQYDWDQQTIPSGLNDAIYIWDGVAGSYKSYVAGVGNNTATQYIAPGQGFWVRTDSGPISFTFDASNRVTSQSTPLYKQAPDIIRLEASEEGANVQDELVIGFDATASYNFDGHLDAQKRFNSGAVPNFFSVISGVDYAINRVPANGTYDSIPLALQYAPQGAKMEITANTDDLQAYSYVELRDAKTGQAIDLKAQPTYQFANDTNMVEGRFSLHFDNHNVSLKENKARQANWFAYQNQDGLMVSFDEKLIGETLLIHNISGVQIAEIAIAQTDVAILKNQPRGVYFLRLKGNTAKVKKVVQP